MKKIKNKKKLSSADEFYNYIFGNPDLLPSVQRENSKILNLLAEETIVKMENTNYRIVVNISTNDFQTFLVYKDLPKGIDNLLTWEYEIAEKYRIDKGSSFTLRNNKNGTDEVIKCDNIIIKATVVFEDEVLQQRSQQYISNFLKKEFAASYEETKDMLMNSSEFLKYLDNYSLEEINAGSEYYIFANVSFKSAYVDDTIKMSHSMRGLGALLYFERYLFEKCCDWASNSFYDFGQPVEFKYDSVEICFEI
ncbi:MAG: hypothetical protein PHT25_03605 [Bacteroidales bacterium]|nr:hypothetical protein [Bacteroidales bacterium]